MAIINDNSGMFMPVAPAYGGGGGFGDFGGGWWIILLLLCGWGGMGGYGMGGFGGGLGIDFPWILNGQNGINANTNNGFRDAMLNDGITSIGDKVTTGFGNVATQLCGGFADVNANITNASMNNMQQLFGVQSALQNCCCENRAGMADVKYTIATEACQTRSANAQNTQAILDKLCQLELDGYKREADNLRVQLSDAKTAASQAAQNAFIQKGFSDEVDALYNRLSNCPVPSTPVYGRTPIFTCNNGYNGCGCGVA